MDEDSTSFTSILERDFSQESYKDLECVEGNLERGLNSEKLYGGQAPEAGTVPYL